MKINNVKQPPLSGENSYVNSLSSKVKADNTILELALVISVDVKYDIVEIFIIGNNKKIKLPFDTTLGLKKDDTVVLMKVQGYYHIITKALLYHVDNEISIYNPSESNPDKLATKEKTPNPLPIDHMKKYFISKFEGDITNYIKETGYKISENFMHLFSATSRIIIDKTKLIFTSMSYERFFHKNFSYVISQEEKTNEVLDYKLSYNKSNIPYMFKAEGELSVLNKFVDIKFVNLDIDLSNAVEIKIIFKALTKDELSKISLKGSVTHKYDFNERKLDFLPEQNSTTISVWDPITRKNIDQKINSANGEYYNAKIKKEIKNAKDIFANNFHIFVNIEDKYYSKTFNGLYVTYLKIITNSGEVIESSKSSTHLSEEIETLTKDKKTITDNYKLIWEQKYKNINMPYRADSYCLYSNYSKFLHKEYNHGLSYNYNPYTIYQTQYQIDINEIKSKLYDNTLTITGKGIDKNLGYENIFIHEKDGIHTPSWKMLIKKGDNKTNVSYSTNTFYSVTGQMNGLNRTFVLNNSMIYTKGFESLYLKDTKNINAGDAFMNLDLLMLNKLYIKDTLNVQAQDIYFKTKNYFIDTDTFQVKMKNGVFVATKHLTLYSTSKVKNGKPQYSGIMMSNNSINIGASKNINVQGYCKCTSQ